MENYKSATEERDPKLWKVAKKRAGFKSSLIAYFIVNAFLWTFWYLTDRKDHDDQWPWPIWTTLGWGVGLLFYFFGAYVYPEINSTEREYEKLKRKQQ